MRRSLLLPCAIALVLPGAAGYGHAQAATGGTSAPEASGAVINRGGGTPYARRRRKDRRPARRRPARRRPRGPVLAAFALRRPRLFLYGAPARLSFRISSHVRLASVRVTITPRGARRAAATIVAGTVTPGREQSVLITGREAGTLPQGAYRLRISARDVRGRRLRRGAGASSTSDLLLIHHRFPLAGPVGWGGPDGRFGAKREGHTHQGQDLAAPEGTPVLAPRGGLIKAVQYQAAGAGHYVVLDGTAEERDYVFMHLRTGSIPVREGQTVRTGQQIGQVGSTGRSFGAHLHFEVWDGPGWYAGGRSVDPLPLLKGWARFI